jgi:hypothetical protein
MRGQIKPSKKTNLTLSIPSQLAVEIKKDAVHSGTSTNAKVNSILAKYVKFYKVSEDLESVVVPTTIWASIVSLVDEDHLRAIMTSAGVETTYSMFQDASLPFSPEIFVRHYCQEICCWSGMFSSFREFKKDGFLTLVFEHKYGIKWSRIMGEALSDFVRGTFDIDVDLEILPGTLKLGMADHAAIKIKPGHKKA